MSELRIHGGQDTQGVAVHDFSTNSNACGPCPLLISALAAVDAGHYPDPAYRALRDCLAAFHGVALERIVLAGSASEFIFRISARVSQEARLRGMPARVELPEHGYGDYGHAALAWGLERSASSAAADLIWACDPSSPVGQAHVDLAQKVEALMPGQMLVLDGAYRPLRLEGALALSDTQLDKVWQLWSPNKALGATGIRAAYAIAPVGSDEQVAQLAQLAPSWPIGAHGCALLMTWVQPEVQAWLADCLPVLRQWKQRQMDVCASLGWALVPSVANFHLAGIAHPEMGQALVTLRTQGIKLRDTASFGLPGRVRMGVLPPSSQDALWQAWKTMGGKR